MQYNFYNRMTTSLLVDKSRLSARSGVVSKIGKNDNEDRDQDDIYDTINDLQSHLVYEMSRDEKYQFIKRSIDQHDELRDTVEKLCDNAIVPDENGGFMSLDVDSSISNEIEKTISESHKRVMKLLGFNNHIEAWSKFYEWSCYGRIAYKIVYEFKTTKELEKEKQNLKTELELIDVNIKTSEDEKIKTKLTESKNGAIKMLKYIEEQKRTGRIPKIIPKDDGTYDVDNDELIPVGIKKFKKLNISYLQEARYTDNPERKIFRYKNDYFDENEIILIDYNHVDGVSLPINGSVTQDTVKISYADSIIRNFNILNRIEVSVVAWTVLNAMYRQKMVVPLTTKIASKAKEAISKVRNKYLDNYEIDSNGISRINGESSFNYMKNIVLAKRNGDTPTVDTVQWNGYDMSDMRIPNYFRENYQRSAKIPSSRYNKDGRVGQLSLYKADGVPYDEISFYNFLDRMLHQFSTAIRKPTLLLTMIKHPELEDEEFMEDNIRYRWNAFSNYLEAKEAEKNTKVLSNIDQMLRFQDTAREQIFDPKYLFVKRFQFMSDDEWDENEKMKNENKVSDGMI